MVQASPKADAAGFRIRQICHKSNMPHHLRRRQQQRATRRRTRQRRAARNRRLRRFGRLNRMFGPPRHSTLLNSGLPVYPINALLMPPVPPRVSQLEFNAHIAHDVERGSDAYYECWQGSREIVGDLMEYHFRRQYSIPVHIPRSAMKLILLFVAEGDELFGAEGFWDTPIEIVTFQWPRPFRWPLR